MKQKMLAVLLLIAAGAAKLQAQNFPGYRTGNYTGVNGVFFNPASIADSRYRWDVNLFSFNGFIGNDKSSFKLKDITSTKSDDLKNKFLGGNGNINANLNIDILGPSAMFNLTRKAAMAITTRARVIANLKDFDGNLVNSITNTGSSTFPYTLSSGNNSRLITNGWSEIGVSYAREIASSGPHFFKAGVTVKYLSGAGNNYVQINNINATLNAETISQRAYMQNASGNIAIGNTGTVVDNVNLNNIINGNNGVGGDIGLVYEYRPDYPNAASDAHNRDLNKYKFKAGLSLLDIGSIRYSTNAATSGSYAMHINGGNRFYLDELKNKNSAEIKAILNSHPNFFTQTNLGGNYNASLPTVLQGDVDYHLHRGFYVSAGGQLNLVSKSSLYSANQYNSFTITPRYEGKSFGIYFPINYNQLTQFNAGISLRAGPLFIGSGSLFTAIAKSKQADVHIGIRFGILQKSKRDAKVAAPVVAETKIIVAPPVVSIDSDGDGIIDSEDKCPNIAGIAKYHGCPIPDTDGDGINDEEDKCPTVAGIAKYQGCPIPDTDGDGVNDEEDKCPTIAGPASNMGCPVIEKVLIDKISYAANNIFFGVGSSKLLVKSNTALNQVATLLKGDETLKMNIDGFTDNTGKADKNLLLSQKRAEAVKTYLVKKGVTENSLVSTGHGIENPVASNKTAAGRAKNRRVELTVRNY